MIKKQIFIRIGLIGCILFIANLPQQHSDQRNNPTKSHHEATFLQLGTHIIAEFVDCASCGSIETLEPALRAAATAAKATVLDIKTHRFEPEGISGIVLLAESHISIHAWPEYKYVAVDAYTCGNSDPYRAIEELKKYIKPQKMELQHIRRGYTSAP